MQVTLHTGDKNYLKMCRKKAPKLRSLFCVQQTLTDQPLVSGILPHWMPVRVS